MKLRYLTVDGMLSGTGIRNSVEGGYVNPEELGISDELIKQIEEWLSRYRRAHFLQLNDKVLNEKLDRDGLAICKNMQEELPCSKIEYYSSAMMRKIL